MSTREASRSLSVAILVISCDKYADLWRPFFHLLDRFWPERPGPVYLLTNHASPQFRGVTPIAVGPDVSWSDNLVKGLSRVREDYVLMCLEDLLLCGPVEVDRLEATLAWVQRHRPNQVRLNPSEPAYRPHDDFVGLVPPGAPYRTSTVLTLWKRDVLSAVVKSGENAWQFETVGSARSDVFGGFFSTHGRCFAVVNGVVKGKWERCAFRRVHALGAPIDVAARPVMTWAEGVRCTAINARARCFKTVPWQWRRALRRLGSKY